MCRKIIALMLVFCVCCASEAFAFMDTTPAQTEQELQNVITSAGHGSTSAHSRLIDELDLYGRLDLTDHTPSEIIGYIQRLEKSGRFPAYVFERGNYTYTGGSNYLYTVGKNIPVYSMPIMQNSSITARLNTNRTDYMFYLGEWRQRNGISWVFAQDDSGNTGWLIGSTVRLVPNARFRQIISAIQRGIQEYNLMALTDTKKNIEVIDTVSEDDITLSEDTETITSSDTQNNLDAKGKKKEAYATMAGSSIVISLMVTFMGLAKYILGKDLR